MDEFESDGECDDYECDEPEDEGDFEDEDVDSYDDSMDGDAESALASVGWGNDEDYGCYNGGDE